MTDSIQTLSLHVGGNLGVNEGGGADGCLAGSLDQAAAAKAFLNTIKQPCLCFTFDSAAVAYVDETTDANDAGTNDVAILNGTTLAIGDAIYFGHATAKFAGVDLLVGQEGDHSSAVWAWEYWDGSAWSALTVGSGNASSIFDGDGTGLQSLTFTQPEDWEQNTVHSSTEGYWVRARVTTGDTVTTQCLLTQAWVVVSDADEAVFTDDTPDFNDADAGDVALLAASTNFASVGDAFYIGHATQKFAKVMVTTSQALTGTVTLQVQYWDGSSWTVIPSPVSDTSSTWTATAGAHVISFEPPSDWATKDVGGTTGYYIRVAITALTSVTQQPLAAIGYVLPISASAVGIRVPVTSGTVTRIDMYAGTASATNADSVFMLLNTTTSAWDTFTWTGGEVTDQVSVSVAVEQDDELVLLQLVEDGTTEFADAEFVLRITV